MNYFQVRTVFPLPDAGEVSRFQRSFKRLEHIQKGHAFGTEIAQHGVDDKTDLPLIAILTITTGQDRYGAVDEYGIM
jgi:hypothetical protein